jgi:hypothetical protein
MKRRTAVFALLVLTLVSCTKDSSTTDSPQPTPPQKTNTVSATAFLKDVRSDKESEYFISGEFDGQKIYLASTLGNMYPSNDTIMNAWYLDESIGLDNMHLIRENQDMSAMIAIYFTATKINTQTFPYYLPHANLAYCEHAEVELTNMKRPYGIIQNGPQDDYSFWGYTYPSNHFVNVTVSSFVNNVMEGSFEGTITTSTGKSMTVKNGRFRIRIMTISKGTSASGL